MKRLAVGMVAAGLVAFALAWWLHPKGVPLERVAALVRAAGDSAVASYDRDVQATLSELRDSVRHYKAEAVAGARVVIRRVPVLVADTTRRATAAAPADTAHVAMPAVHQDGVTVEESLTVAPAPALLARRLFITWDPDTVLVALLRTPDGLQRFTALATRAGVGATVVDAAATAPKPRTSLPAVVLTAAGCGTLGYALARPADDGSRVWLLLGGGGACALGITRLRRAR